MTEASIFIDLAKDVEDHQIFAHVTFEAILEELQPAGVDVI